MPIAPDYFVYDGDPTASPVVNARRPGIGDVGNGDKQDDDQFPPDPETMPTAAEDNQKSKCIVALGGVSPSVVLDITFTAGAPSITRMTACSTTLEIADFTVTDEGNGQTLIAWAGSLLPVPQWNAGAWQTDDVEIDRIRCISLTNSVRVKTKLGATGTDANFSVSIG